MAMSRAARSFLSILEVGLAEFHTLDAGGRVDGHRKHLPPLHRIKEIGIRLDKGTIQHGYSIPWALEAVQTPFGEE
jgi:hypothetical protein